eukprot:Anaeramoba_ignava/a217132_45.p1 GENE.a217132_45~~a217132_45.p1  ORF type:complete len:741 (+),score=178.53 a217132_45:129-2225(+)
MYSNYDPELEVYRLLPYWKTTMRKVTPNIGLGVGLFFGYLFRMIFVFLLIMGLSILNMVLNTQGTDEIECLNFDTYGFWTATTLGNNSRCGWTVWKQAVVQFAISWVVLFSFSNRMSRILSEYQTIHQQEHRVTSSFTIHVSNLPEDATNPREIKQYFSEWGKVVDVCIVYNLKPILKQSLALEKMRTKKQEKILYSQEVIDSIDSRISEIEEKIEKLAEDYYKCTGHCFVTYEKVFDASRCTYAFSHSFLKRFLCSCCIEVPKFRDKIRLKVSKAPEIQDIIWQNMEFSRSQRFWRSVGINLLCILLICANGAVIYFLSRYGSKKSRNFFSFLISVAILATNRLIVWLIVKVSNFTKKLTKTEIQESQVTKILFLQIINSVGVIFFSAGTGDFVETYSYASVVIMTLIGDALLLPVLNVFGIRFLAAFRRWRGRRRSHTQARLNKSYIPSQVSLAKLYTKVLKTMTLCFIFIGAVPLAGIAGFISLILNFLLNKLNVLRTWRNSSHLSSGVHTHAMSLLPWLYILHSFATMLWFSLQQSADPFKIVNKLNQTTDVDGNNLPYAALVFNCGVAIVFLLSSQLGTFLRTIFHSKYANEKIIFHNLVRKFGEEIDKIVYDPSLGKFTYPISISLDELHFVKSPFDTLEVDKMTEDDIELTSDIEDHPNHLQKEININININDNKENDNVNDNVNVNENYD